MNQIIKYPRTHHIAGSRLQPGDEDLNAIPFEKLEGRFLVVEEKVDGANCGISFSDDGQLRLQSRGHYLTGGGREKHFSLFKRWATTHTAILHDLLGGRFIMYGEWLFAKHTIFYDQLPHYFQEFDIYDKENQEFLSTERRRTMLNDLPVVSVRVLHSGTIDHRDDLMHLLGKSAFIGNQHREKLKQHAIDNGLELGRVLRETDRSNLMEGLYIKVEEDGVVKERYKFVRYDFLAAVFAAQGHWLNRPILPNLLADGVDIYDS